MNPLGAAQSAIKARERWPECQECATEPAVIHGPSTSFLFMSEQP